ncbi:hypothetical protein ACG2F4_08355 [Halalkalibaculum sp. DA3122]|uniref:hypothetical protein n=1 Tax=unclassified Halalkalibaculum TaxID=2964617 RepID=UPI003754B94B
MSENSREEVTQEQLDELVEDAAYLQDEAEALKYVIDEVPYTETPPGGESIAEMLLLIDHAQLSYYRPVIEDAYQNSRPTRLDNYDHFESTFQLDEEKAKDIQKTLSKIVKHRAGLVNLLKKIPLIDWETIIYKNKQELLLYEFARNMIHFERGKLKDIADLVMVFNQEKQAQREIRQRAGQRPSPNNNPPSTDN